MDERELNRVFGRAVGGAAPDLGPMVIRAERAGRSLRRKRQVGAAGAAASVAALSVAGALLLTPGARAGGGAPTVEPAAGRPAGTSGVSGISGISGVSGTVPLTGRIADRILLDLLPAGARASGFGGARMDIGPTEGRPTAYRQINGTLMLSTQAGDSWVTAIVIDDFAAYLGAAVESAPPSASRPGSGPASPSASAPPSAGTTPTRAAVRPIPPGLLDRALSCDVLASNVSCQLLRLPDGSYEQLTERPNKTDGPTRAALVVRADGTAVRISTGWSPAGRDAAARQRPLPLALDQLGVIARSDAWRPDVPAELAARAESINPFASASPAADRPAGSGH